MVDARDLKSLGLRRAGSSPALGTRMLVQASHRSSPDLETRTKSIEVRMMFDNRNMQLRSSCEQILGPKGATLHRRRNAPSFVMGKRQRF